LMFETATLGEVWSSVRRIRFPVPSRRCEMGRSTV